MKYQDVFLLQDGMVTQWRLKNGRLVICEKDGHRKVPYDGKPYWMNWEERMRFQPSEDHSDAIFLSDQPDSFFDVPEWASVEGETSRWAREDLELLGEEDEFQGKALVLVRGTARKILCRGLQGAEEVVLNLRSSFRFELDEGVTDEVIRLQEKADAIAAPAESPRKQELISVCDDLRGVVAEGAAAYGNMVDKRLAEIADSISHYVFRINLVGPFSCGKSSLLNRWLGMEHLLPTGIAPETAISTELRYGHTPKMVLFPLKKSDPVVTLDGVTAANMKLVRDRANHQELINVAVYLNHPLLKTYADLCLVDLPGLNSANPAHEAALDRFIEDQEAGIFCVPMADGTVQGDAIEFLKKMELFHSRFNLLLTKSDEKPVSEHAAIMETAGRAIRLTLGISKDDFVIGKVSNTSVDCFEMMLDDFQMRKDEYITGRFGWEIRNAAAEIEGPLRKAMAGNYNNAKLEESLARLEATERNLPETMNDIMQDVRLEIVPASGRILERVKSAVMSQKARYLAMAKRGEDCSVEVSSLVKSMIAYEAGNAMQDVVSRANAKAESVLGNCLDFDVGATDGVDASVDGGLPQAGEKGSKIGALLGGVGGGGAGFVIGNIIFPGLGGIIGGILGSFLGGLFGGGKKEEDAESRIEAEFTANLDAACNNTRPQIVKILTQAVEAYGNNLQNAVSGRLQALTAQAKEIKAEVAAGRAEWEKKQSVRAETLKKVEKILSRLEAENG